jgi:predicted ATPase
MTITLIIAGRNSSIRSQRNTAVLTKDNWDDFNFKTLFSLTIYDDDGEKHDIGNVKIGYFGQESGLTSDKLLENYTELSEEFFSLGQDVDYYKNINEKLSTESKSELLNALKDVIHAPLLLKRAENEKAFSTSLTRSISANVINHQYKRVLNGDAALSEFNFSYKYVGDEKHAAVDISFEVTPASKPPSNIHVLIGRNGVGKTTLLNNMVDSIVDPQSLEEVSGKFYSLDWQAQPIPNDYFSGVVSVSFSAFDSRVPPEERDQSSGIAYSYVGLKKIADEGYERKAITKDHDDLCADFIKSLKACLSLQAKKQRWIVAIKRLESDTNFEEMNLSRLAALEIDQVSGQAALLFKKMSSGHALVLLTMTKLVETVEEKTLVILDEPESHLHPPLLSAFTRALSELLIGRNGVAIIATHSPVVIQEVPKACVWILSRSKAEGRSDRPSSETFGENVGVLTREIFGLEVTKSGFHALLKEAVGEGKSFDEIKTEYGEQLGFEAQAILRALIYARDIKNEISS